MKRLLLIVALLVSAGMASQAREDEDGSTTRDTVYGVPASEIVAYPEPDVTPLAYDHQLSHDRIYNQITGRKDIYDAPNGSVIGSLDDGFNFITVYDSVEGWISYAPNRWIQAENVTNTNRVVTQFTGVFLPEDALPYTMAWLLVNLYPATAPGGTPNETENALMYRYTRVNIYDTVDVDGWRWYQIGVNQWVHQTQVAKVLPVERPADVVTDHWVSIDLYEQVMIAYEGERPVFTTLVATGLPRWPTEEGIFNIYWRRQREDMSWGTPGDDFYFLEEVPWTMFFDEGRALHGAYWHDGFGYRRSHGCVNLPITDAHWLYEWVADEMGTYASADREEGPQVYVYSSGSYE